MDCRSVHTRPKLLKSASSIWVSSSLIPPTVGVLDAARTVDTRDETREVGVAEPAVADDERPLGLVGDKVPLTGVAAPFS